MVQSRKWLAALAATGSAVGAGIALSNAPGASASAGTTTGRETSQTAQLAAVEAEANQLQSMIANLRQQLEAERSQPTPSVDQSSLLAEREQLASEANQLNAERESLAATAAKLQAEQQQLAAEAKQLASQPTTHATTGASGATPTGDGGTDN